MPSDLGSPYKLTPVIADAQHGKVSVKIDAYAFGLVCLELLTARSPSKQDLQQLVRT
jgi:hypothetical protein